jgi:hypothetical protein
METRLVGAQQATDTDAGDKILPNELWLIACRPTLLRKEVIIMHDCWSRRRLAGHGVGRPDLVRVSRRAPR